MADIRYELDKLLSKIGISSKSLLRVRFGGVVGKLALVAIFVVVGLAIVSRQTTDAEVQRLCAAHDRVSHLGWDLFALPH